MSPEQFQQFIPAAFFSSIILLLVLFYFLIAYTHPELDIYALLIRNPTTHWLIWVASSIIVLFLVNLLFGFWDANVRKHR